MKCTLQIPLYKIGYARGLIVLIVILNVPTYANNKDISNLHIISDTLIIDRIKQKAEYLGNVVVYFDDAILKTEKLYIIYKTVNKENTIDYIEIPTKLEVEKKINNEFLLADSAKYFLDNKQLILLGNVILQRDGNILKTNKLIYYVYSNEMDSMKINLKKSNRSVSREAERTKVREHSRSYKDDDANLRGSSSIDLKTITKK